VAAANILKEHGATSIRAAVSHAMLTQTGLERLAASPISELIATDSVPMATGLSGYPVTILSVGDLIGDAILRIHNDESVNSLFEV
jgi:ribose-phosphate pyrophosphokinase